MLLLRRSGAVCKVELHMRVVVVLWWQNLLVSLTPQLEVSPNFLVSDAEISLQSQQLREKETLYWQSKIYYFIQYYERR